MRAPEETRNRQSPRLLYVAVEGGVSPRKSLEAPV